MKEQLVRWEPIKKSPFCRRNNEMNLVKFSYDKHLVLVFEDIKRKEQYTFSYEHSEGEKPFLTFRITEELTRFDIDQLIHDFYSNEEGASLNYGATFYKVLNSSFLAWYDEQYEPRGILQPDAEHHLFVTSTVYIDVISEIQPLVSIIK